MEIIFLYICEIIFIFFSYSELFNFFFQKNSNSTLSHSFQKKNKNKIKQINTKNFFFFKFIDTHGLVKLNKRKKMKGK